MEKTGVLSSFEVANMLNDWYVMMKKREINDAIQLKEDILRAFDRMEEDQDVLLYYQLLEYRFKDLIEDTSSLDHSLFVDEDAIRTDDMLSYYFDFFKGMYEMRRGNHDTAFHHLKLAENNLDLVHDDIEKAEFHYKTGCLYYNIRSTLLSIHHLKKASSIYDADPCYVKKSISCQMMLGLNYADQAKYDKAEALLQQVIHSLEQMEDLDLLGHAYCNAAFIKSLKKEYSDAAPLLKKALLLETFETSSPSGYLLAMYAYTKALFKLKNTSLFHYYVQLSLQKADHLKQRNISLKLSILELLMLQPNNMMEQIISYCDQLESMNFLVDLEAICEDIAEYLTENGHHEESTYFQNKALSFKQS
ncbi:tetratricopeptide repeat protein [Bacillus sp. 179-C3.3 HS]|uniref:response regulator aspartate phosphatase n=1 Tax=Bacillus sp. 179-C3.3 HS TaxID=3232162 RepID=UPI0039A3F7B8